MCCLTQDPANPYTVTIVDCCTLKISNADGTLIDTFNLNDLDYQVANGILYLKDGVNTRTINVADAPAIFGVADIAAVLAFIDTAVTECKCAATPVPVTLDVLNCDGTTTPTVFDQAPAKVEIVQTKPLVICKSSVDFEIGCSSVDGRTIVRTYVQDENGVITSQVFEQDGVTPVSDGSILVKCDFDIEDVEFCYQDITDNSIKYRHVVFVNVENNLVLGSIWMDLTGAVIAAPTNIEPCAQADEIDILYTNWLPICVDGVQWYVAERITFNNTTAIEGVSEKVYKQGANGAIVTTAPTGTVITEGVCKVYEKEVCGTIDGSIDVYELVKIYTRDNKGVQSLLHYEDKFGNQITGAVVETCCTCDSLCDYVINNNPTPNLKCAGYSATLDPNTSQSSLMQGYGRHTAAYWDAQCGVGSVTGYTWELDSFIHNGVEQITTPMIVTVPFTSMTYTPAGVPTNFATAFNTLLNTKGVNLDPDMATKSYVNGDTFTLAFRHYPNPIACSAPAWARLEIITESGDGWEYMGIANPTLAQIQAFTLSNNFVNQRTNSICQTI